jgi:hypothetical protein
MEKKKKRDISNHKISRKDVSTERILIENFVSLQKVMTNLSVKFDNLTHKISKLLDLFEISAKALAEKDFEIERNNRENMRIIEKIENVLEQNRTIARGLTLMHDKINVPQGHSPQIPERQRAPLLQKSPYKPLSEETKSILNLEEKQKNPLIGGNPEGNNKPLSSNEQ